jgi:hypothetical protein
MNIDSRNGTEAQLTDRPAAFADPQLELALAEGSAPQLVGPRPRRQSRASWWFQRMRQLVDHACDWQPALTPRPEQIWFPNAHRTVSLLAQSNADQRQLCE